MLDWSPHLLLDRTNPARGSKARRDATSSKILLLVGALHAVGFELG